MQGGDIGMLRKVVVQRKGPTILAKHSHLFQFVGALLVFLTFICHEVLHDRWKDLADAIDATRSTMLIRKDIEQTNIGIREIQQISFELWDAELSQASGGTWGRTGSLLNRADRTPYFEVNFLSRPHVSPASFSREEPIGRLTTFSHKFLQ
jgi:hypothetical protein